MFVDEAQICVQAGSGGNGCISFHREKYKPRGGPDGGDGGRGGDVVIVADRRVATLSHFRHRIHWKAPCGGHGSGSNRKGRTGRTLVVKVPPGTIVKDLDGVVWADLANHGDKMLAARGGAAGRRNASFVSPVRRAPNFAELGQPGEERWLRLELKLLADVGLVGMPNAGKSSLLRRISRARPKVAGYPFTTLWPVLGSVESHGIEFVVADIPGLIEGASQGRGLGDRFLRHIERCRVLVIVLDLACSMGVALEEQEEILLEDLRAYSSEVLERPRVIVANKVDLEPEAFRELQRKRPEVLGISALEGRGVDELVARLAALVQSGRKGGPRRPSFLLYRPRPRGFLVERRDGRFEVLGPVAERLSRVHPFDSRQAVAYVSEVLRRTGIEKALIAAGIEDGDSVMLGDREMVWSSDASGGAGS